jgi:hypothetical protein
VRRSPYCVGVLLLLPALFLQRGTAGKVSVGNLEANAHAVPNTDPPVENRTRQVDLAKLKENSLELRRLADSLPEQIQAATSGQLPKDLGDNLKKIEKLAKDLRKEVVP